MRTPLTVGMVVHGGVTPRTTASLLSLAATVAPTYRILETTIVAHGRNLVAGAVEEGRLLFVDSDMAFDPGHVSQLEAALQENPRRGAVSALYVKRDGSGLPVCNWRDANGSWLSDEVRRRKAAVLRGVVRVDSCGAGLLLIDKAALDAVGSPWFETEYEGSEFVGEDANFCKKLIAAGFEPSVDFDCRVWHCGQISWHPDMFYGEAKNVV